MGYVLAFSPCLLCGKVFGYNPHKVPSSSALTGTREPVCAGCMGRMNVKRRELGLEPFPIEPDAYEPCDEQEL